MDPALADRARSPVNHSDAGVDERGEEEPGVNGLEQIPLGALAWLVVPLVLMGLTSFTRVSVVLSALRVGLGAENLLPTAAIYTLAILVTGLAMAPTLGACVEAGRSLAAASEGQSPEAMLAVFRPLLEFAHAHADPAELEFVAQLGGRALDDPLVVALGFMVSELSSAFRAVVYLLLPFILIDLVVAQICALLSLTVQQQLVSLPIKLLLFLAVGGWHLVLDALVRGYRLPPT